MPVSDGGETADDDVSRVSPDEVISPPQPVQEGEARSERQIVLTHNDSEWPLSPRESQETSSCLCPASRDNAPPEFSVFMGALPPL